MYADSFDLLPKPGHPPHGDPLSPSPAASGLPSRIWQMARPLTLAEVHQLLNQLAAGAGFRHWVVLVEDWRTLAQPRRYTLSNHPRAWPGPVEVPGAFANAAFSDMAWQMRTRLPPAPEGDERLVIWPEHLATEVGRGFSVLNRFTTSDLALSFMEHTSDPETLKRPLEVSGDFKLLSMMVHTLLLPMLTQVYIEKDGTNLTRRELACLQWAALGKTANETASLIFLSEHTINFHINRAIKKLNASNRSHAVAIVVAMGLVRLGEQPGR